MSGTARSILPLGAWLVALLVGVVAASDAQTTAAGRRTFETSCATCHGLNGKGGERGPDIATRPEVVRLSDGETLKVFREGKPQTGMPGFAALGQAQLSDVLGYLRVLQGKRRASTAAAGAEKGKQLFAGKARCSECHMVRGAGGFLGPDLSDYGASHSAADIRKAILRPETRPAARKGLAEATTRDGRHVVGLVRNEDNFSLQLQALDGAFQLLDKSELAELRFASAPVMPDDYGARLSSSELDELVAYLSSLSNARRDAR